MAVPETWIKLNRNITKWGWYTDANTMRVFIHFLLKANVEDKVFLGIPIRRGELATSYPKLASELHMTNREVRTAISHLKLTGEVTVNTYSKFSHIIIENYEKYQDTPEDTNKNKKVKKRGDRQNGSQPLGQATGKRQSNDSQTTTTKEYKNIRNKEYKENIGAAPSLPSAVSEYVPQKWEVDEVPERLWGKFDSVADWEAWRDK